MSRYHLIDMLSRYADCFPEEVAVAERIAALVAGRGNCLLRECRPGHLTGSAWVVSRDFSRVALVHHRKLDKWLQPGGHADGDADLAGVAWREASEELGLRGMSVVQGELGAMPLDIDVHMIPARFDTNGQLFDDAHEHHDLRYLLIAGADETLVLSDESNEVRWVEMNDLERFTTEVSVLRLRRKCLAFRASAGIAER